ncbi:26680_t:CDS:2 [Gigaspora margarita]|uniref:26680_t:CDS:1 n=1 Tax=Gigaspora margarita TaxID=4874 RepID=A0ABN7UV10_GIGMA|nr:26680_t:CDS:2 [Gigaspora margarita]
MIDLTDPAEIDICNETKVRTYSNWNEISNKLRQAFENYRITYNNDKKPLKKHIDALDYNTFKSYQSEVKSLKTLIATSFEIHMKFLIAESKGENLNYNFMVLNHIKELDSLTINCKFLAASHLQYANQLELKEEQERLKK